MKRYSMIGGLINVGIIDLHARMCISSFRKKMDGRSIANRVEITNKMVNMYTRGL